MEYGMVSAAYIAASILFILSLGGLSNQESAQRGNLFGIAGIGLAIVATIAGSTPISLVLVLVVMAITGFNIGEAVILFWHRSKRLNQ